MPYIDYEQHVYSPSRYEDMVFSRFGAAITCTPYVPFFVIQLKIAMSKRRNAIRYAESNTKHVCIPLPILVPKVLGREVLIYY